MEQSLEKKYGLPTAIAMVVGIVIGSGIFFKAEKILLATGGNLKIGMLAWLVGGFIALSCACTFAQFETTYTTENGIVGYAERIVGSRYAYYLGWFLATMYYPSLTACLAWVSARYTCVLLGYDVISGESMTLTLFYLILLFFINTLAPYFAGKLQVSFTVLKLIPILAMGIFGTYMGMKNGLIVENFSSTLVDTSVSHPFFSALVATAFAYEGWILATTIGGELKNSTHILPLALIFGVASITLIYLIYYIGLAGAVPNDTVMNHGEEGARIAFSSLFGEGIGSLLFVFVVLSCLGTCNGLMMGCSRGFFTLAQLGKGPFPKLLSQVDPSSNMPTNSGITGLLLTSLWVFYFYFGTLTNQLGPFVFDASEVPIITLYAMYIPLFYLFMKKNSGKPIYQRYLIPICAICSCLFITVSGIYSYGLDLFYYLILYIFIMLLGFYFEKNRIPLS